LNGPFPEFELRTYLLGHAAATAVTEPGTGFWTVERDLLDRANGTRGTFSGVVQFVPADDGGLAFREAGTMHWPTFTGPATREYVLKPTARPDMLDVFFPDGRPFHSMSFTPEANLDHHWCDPDTYRVAYTFGDADSFTYSWDVKGPQKDLLLVSRLARRREGSMKNRIVVSAVCVFDNAGRLLTVRKRGTAMFMHPGGKPEAGESAVQAAARELAEEVGIVLEPSELQLMGVWIADAANEAATDIEATVFMAPGTWEAHPSAEIAEIRWLDLAALDRGAPLPADLAPLLTDHILPQLAGQA
jgi:8-oxo-dGTP pyrophosphatase MutT (NUDIX family)